MAHPCSEILLGPITLKYRKLLIISLLNGNQCTLKKNIYGPQTVKNSYGPQMAKNIYVPQMAKNSYGSPMAKNS